MFKALKRQIPFRLKRFVRQAVKPLARNPELHYVELHLTDHCNMKCKGCGHYCPISPVRYAKLRQHKKDMRRLSQLLRNIRQIRLMGGEPLLHPDPASFLRVTRQFFPETDLRFVTNGLLLPKASPVFWKACRETGAVIDLTLYPPMKDQFEAWRELCEKNQVPLNVLEAGIFFAHRDLSGTSDRKKAFTLCRERYFCPYLENGRMYICAMSSLVRHFNTRFGCRIPRAEGINIHSPFVIGRDIMNYLSEPVETCEWCAYDPVPFDWDVGSRVPQEWFPEMDADL